MFEIAYLSTLGHKLTAPGTRTINQVDPSRIGPGNAQALRPFPQFSDVRVIAPTIGNSNYHGLNLRVDKRFSRGLQFNANYTWSKAIDDVESRDELGGNAGDNAFANQYDRRADRGLSGNHIAHRFIGSATWELPLGVGRAWRTGNGILDNIVGGWSTSVIYEVRTGSPFGVIENNAAAIYPTAATVRSNVAGAVSRESELAQQRPQRDLFRPDLIRGAGPVHVRQLGPNRRYRPGRNRLGRVTAQEHLGL